MPLIIYKKETNNYLRKKKANDVILMSNKERKLRVEVYN